MIQLLENGLKPIVIFDGLLNDMKIRHHDAHQKKVKQISDALVTKIINVNYLFKG
jgi:hypothetical protein